MTRDNTPYAKDQTEDLETRPDLTWRDIEDLQTLETGDPEHIFTSDPETDKTWRSVIGDTDLRYHAILISLTGDYRISERSRVRDRYTRKDQSER